MELLLCAAAFARPRQFMLQAEGALDGAGVQEVLDTQFDVPRWYCGARALEELGPLPRDARLLLSDLPGGGASADPGRRAGGGLQLYVPQGPNAGARLVLCPGRHQVGRCAPLWLDDPAVSRRHASVQVDAQRIMLHAEDGARLEVFEHGAFHPVRRIQLRRGMRLRLGGTELRVDDPLAQLPAAGLDWPRTVPVLPGRPELGRLLTLLGAALVPLAIGLVLLAATGSKIFLLISGVSAGFGLIPALGLLRQRRRWIGQARQHTCDLLRLRRQLAPPLGAVIAAGASPEYRWLGATSPPPLLFGDGVWDPGAGASGGASGGAPGGGAGSTGEHRFLEPGRRGSLAAASPVFALRPTGAWQLRASRPGQAVPVLLALLAQLLPSVVCGTRQLVLDPHLPDLPSTLLLLPGVRLGVPPGHGAQALALAGPLPPTNTGAGISPDGEVGRNPPVYVLAGAAAAVPGALVLGLGPGPVSENVQWIDVHTLACQLDDPQARLDSLHRLAPEHFARLVESLLLQHRATQPLLPGPLRAQAHTTDPAETTGAPETLTCTLGLDDRGAAVQLDVLRDGPHLLLAGTTGSGKSEALRRIITELSARYAPGDLALALVDFKGGASLSVFAALAHTQLFASDLDAAGALRMLQQLELEIGRRERLLHAHGCGDIAHYRQHRGRQDPPLPRLLVIVDEFRVFLDDAPGAAQRIDRIATVGRALGIHLLLSTQKPGGTLSGQTRANINTVIALRVRDPAESSDLVGTPQAAHFTLPGHAVLTSPTIGRRVLRFALAAPTAPHGILVERHRRGFGLTSPRPFGRAPTAAEAMGSLDAHVAALAARWADSSPAPSPFAPPLPTGLGAPALPPGMAPATLEPGQSACGWVDELAAGTWGPLLPVTAAAGALLVHGLPESGTAYLAGQLARIPRRILYFDAAPLPEIRAEAAPSPPGHAPHLLLFTGQDAYRVADALDFLAAGRALDDVLVVVRNMGALAAALPPALFAHLDDVLGTVIRQASGSGANVVLIGDRDTSALKCAQLCAARWYFPLGAPQSLQMMWPKLPAVSALVGRGVAVDAAGATRTIQLTQIAAPPPNRPRFTTLQSSGADNAAPARDYPRGYPLGLGGLLGEPVAFFPQRIGFVLVADPGLRRTVAKVLCSRWAMTLHRDTAADGEHRAQPAADPGPRRAGFLLETAVGPGQLGLINELAQQGCAPVVFCAPSMRLAYEFGLPGLQIDEREVVVIEPRHPLDLQPLAWGPLPAAEAERADGSWRAVCSIAGQPRQVLIPHP